MKVGLGSRFLFPESQSTALSHPTLLDGWEDLHIFGNLGIATSAFSGFPTPQASKDQTGIFNLGRG